MKSFGTCKPELSVLRIKISPSRGETLSTKTHHLPGMTETNGHFEKGIWIEETFPATGTPVAIDRRLSEATKSVSASIDALMNVAHDLVTTDEGRKCIGRTFEEAQAQLRKSFDEIIARAKLEVEKAKAGKPAHSSQNARP